MKIEQNSCVIVKFNAVLGYWRFMQIRQRIFNYSDMQIKHFILDKYCKTVDILHACLSLVVAKLSNHKAVRFFGPPCVYVCESCVLVVCQGSVTPAETRYDGAAGEFHCRNNLPLWYCRFHASRCFNETNRGQFLSCLHYSCQSQQRAQYICCYFILFNVLIKVNTVTVW